MAGENEPVADATKSAKDYPDEGRQRSTIGFPYNDLNDAIEVAKAAHSHAGVGECGEDELAARLDHSVKSSGFRVRLSAARLFNLIEATSGGYRLSSVGRAIVDPQKEREARSQAFLNVPLYSAVYNKYRGGVLPPPAALERDMVLLGVAEKQKGRARSAFERSADQAGFFEHGKDRLVKPGLGPAEMPPEAEKQRRGWGESGDGGGYHPFVQGLLQTLPEPESEWPITERVKWLQAAAQIFGLIYKGDGDIRIEAGSSLTKKPKSLDSSPEPPSGHDR